MTFPHYIQKAVDLGLLVAEGDRIVDCKKEEVETIMGMARIIEKIQPTTTAKEEDTTDQEAIVLIRVLSSPSGLARELWADLRIAFGVGHGQTIPDNLWSTDVFRAIGREIDLTFTGERDGSLISREVLIRKYAELSEGSRSVGIMEFNQTISTLSDKESMKAYGDAASEWNVALDLLRQARVRAVYEETQHAATQAERTKGKIEKQIEFQQQRLMECLGMLHGSIGNQGNAVDAVEDLFADDNVSILNRIINAREQKAPVSTGILAMDLDMEGGVREPGQEAGGRLFCLAARTGVGKTQLAVHAFVNLAAAGLTVGFISAELDKAAIYARIWASATHRCNENDNWVSVGAIESPGVTRERDASCVTQAAGIIQAAGGKMLVEDPWGADVDAVINSLRSMKAKNPELRAAFVDHFHCLGRHKGAPSSEAAMMEERAYKLMTVAKELQIDLIVLAQMNRVGMDALASKQPPGLDQIRGTDALSHVSHAVWIARREPRAQGEDESAVMDDKNRALEFWHVKTRGRQAYWRNGEMRGVKGFVDCSKLTMNYPYSSVRKNGDDTAAYLR
ncbi:DNA helicase [Synechococcus phage S-CRES2]|nr:DNA helicase [Synechococcus phage S-CRES1]WGL30541.1 DNA helicase [Synechococcus phage S-CRES2]